MRLIWNIFARLHFHRTFVRAGRTSIRGSASHHAEQMINCHYGSRTSYQIVGCRAYCRRPFFRTGFGAC